MVSPAHDAGNFMRYRGLAGRDRHGRAGRFGPRCVRTGHATLLRVFLKDGTSLVSYGEPARVADRVIFSMPTRPHPIHRFISSTVGRACGWDRTERYDRGAPAPYVATQADIDYAELSNQMTQVLNDVTLTTEPRAARHRRKRAEDARRVAGEPLQLTADGSPADG